jgi:hypothetical protein
MRASFATTAHNVEFGVRASGSICSAGWAVTPPATAVLSRPVTNVTVAGRRLVSPCGGVLLAPVFAGAGRSFPGGEQ